MRFVYRPETNANNGSQLLMHPDNPESRFHRWNCKSMYIYRLYKIDRAPRSVFVPAQLHVWAATLSWSARSNVISVFWILFPLMSPGDCLTTSIQGGPYQPKRETLSDREQVSLIFKRPFFIFILLLGDFFFTSSFFCSFSPFSRRGCCSTGLESK